MFVFSNSTGFIQPLLQSTISGQTQNKVTLSITSVLILLPCCRNSTHKKKVMLEGLNISDPY